jgi:hypothetical protein
MQNEKWKMQNAKARERSAATRRVGSLHFEF